MWMLFLGMNFVHTQPDPTAPIADALSTQLRLQLSSLFGTECSDQSPVFGVHNTLSYELAVDRVLLQVPCTFGAYNRVYAFFIQSSEGLQVLTFARPEAVVNYSEPRESVKRVQFVGISAREMLVNARYDPQTKMLTEFSLGRGLGDMFQATRWVYAEQDFQLLESWDDSLDDGKQSPQLLYHHPGYPRPEWSKSD